MNSVQSLLSPLQNSNNDAHCCNVLYVTESSVWGELGYNTVSSAFRSVFPIFWSPNMPKPNLSDWHGDWIISFKSDLILAPSILERARNGAINFHPCPPKYRGLGGYWWALHNGDNVFGVTCHHMDRLVDHGGIIETKEFPIYREETEESLKRKAALYSLDLLNKIINDIIAEKPLTPCETEWGQHLYTSKELIMAKARAMLDENLYRFVANGRAV